MYRSLGRYVWIFEDMRGYARICEDMRGYSRICEDIQGYARICEERGSNVGVSLFGKKQCGPRTARCSIL